MKVEPSNAVDIFAGVTGALVATVAILAGVRQVWQATFGSRRALARKLEGLRVGMSAGHIQQVLGPPTFGAVDRDDSVHVEGRAVWALSHGFFAAAFVHGAVVAFVVITTDRWFRPSIGAVTRGLMRGRLGTHSFERVALQPPDRISCQLGASTVEYAEHHYLGRPGAYCDYVLTASGEGVPLPEPPTFTVDRDTYEHVGDRVDAFRRSNVVNCVTVAAADSEGFLLHSLLMERIGQHALSLRKVARR